MRGNFIGLASPVIDLTTLDTSGYVASNDSFSSSSVKRRVKPKKELMSLEAVEGVSGEGVSGEGVRGEGVSGGGVRGEGVRGEGEGVRGEGVRGEGVRGDGQSQKRDQKKGGEGKIVSKKQPKRRSRLIPLALVRATARRPATASSEDDAGGEGGGKEGVSLDNTRDKESGKSSKYLRQKKKVGGKVPTSAKETRATKKKSITEEAATAAASKGSVGGVVTVLEETTGREEGEGEREEGERGTVLEDCLVSPSRPKPRSPSTVKPRSPSRVKPRSPSRVKPRSPSRVKVVHKLAKKKVSISNEVVVMGEGGGEWSSLDQRDLFRYRTHTNTNTN